MGLTPWISVGVVVCVCPATDSWQVWKRAKVFFCPDGQALSSENADHGKRR